MPVPDLDTGLACYAGVLGQRPAWRDDAVGQAGLLVADATSPRAATPTVPSGRS